MAAIDYASQAELFDYETEAELFSIRRSKSRRQSLGYRRFTRAADAIRFAVEDQPQSLLLGTYLEVNEVRFDGGAIRRLYDSPGYPLPRRAAA